MSTGKNPQELHDPVTGETVWQQYAPNISSNFAAVIDRAIRPRVSDRYSTVAQMLSDLQASPPAETTNQATVPLLSQPDASRQVTKPGVANSSRKYATP